MPPPDPVDPVARFVAVVMLAMFVQFLAGVQCSCVYQKTPGNNHTLAIHMKGDVFGDLAVDLKPLILTWLPNQTCPYRYRWMVISIRTTDSRGTR